MQGMFRVFLDVPRPYHQTRTLAISLQVLQALQAHPHAGGMQCGYGLQTYSGLQSAAARQAALQQQLQDQVAAAPLTMLTPHDGALLSHHFCMTGPTMARSWPESGIVCESIYVSALHLSGPTRLATHHGSGGCIMLQDTC